MPTNVSHRRTTYPGRAVRVQEAQTSISPPSPSPSPKGRQRTCEAFDVAGVYGRRWSLTIKRHVCSFTSFVWFFKKLKIMTIKINSEANVKNYGKLSSYSPIFLSFFSSFRKFLAFVCISEEVNQPNKFSPLSSLHWFILIWIKVSAKSSWREFKIQILV